MSCTSGCPTQDHVSWGACLRSKRISINDPGGTGIARQWDADLTAYADARRQGIQPSSVTRDAVDRAVRISNADGEAFRA